MKVFVLDQDEHADILFAKVLKEIKEFAKPAVITLQSGRYLFHKNEAEICRLPVSNTVAYDGNIPYKHNGHLVCCWMVCPI